MNLVLGHCQVDSLTGAVASQKVTEALKGSLSTVGNRTKSVKAKESLIARHTGRARTKVGLSDPVVPHGRAIAQRSFSKNFVASKNIDFSKIGTEIAL